MKKKTLKFGKGFRIALGNRRSEAAEMVIAPGDAEGDPANRHRGSDQWLFVLSGTGLATIDEKRDRLRENVLLLIEHGERHEIRNNGKTLLRTLNFYVPPAYTKGGETLPRGRR
ncbi:MAG: cupin domain-containing protein [Betaproteobacteria bacterium]|nr:MAG: cupin domain-containing protein [Betaproteobacteria bacterium]